jgi:hypothetical protein
LEQKHAGVPDGEEESPFLVAYSCISPCAIHAPALVRETTHREEKEQKTTLKISKEGKKSQVLPPQAVILTFMPGICNDKG